MKLVIDSDDGSYTLEEDGRVERGALYSQAGFDAVSRQWVRVAFAVRHSYTFTWLGRPVIQLPEDLLRVQELIVATRPDVIVETGVAHGGTAVFYASLCELCGNGRVIAVDVEIRPHNRRAIEAHAQAPRIALIEGSSTDPATVSAVKARIQPGERVMVVLDSRHDRAHIAGELEAYAELVAPGCYLIVNDGIISDLSDLPNGKPAWRHDNAHAAIEAFLAAHDEFELGAPPWAFNESTITRSAVSHWPAGYLRRRG